MFIIVQQTVYTYIVISSEYISIYKNMGENQRTLYIPGGIERGGGRIKCPPIRVGGPGIICRMGAIIGPATVIPIGGPDIRTGNLCIIAA